MEAAGGARSSVEELLCAAGRTGRWEETRTIKGWKRIILLKKKKFGFTKTVAGGRQPKVDQNRQMVTFITLHNFVGRCRREDDKGQDKC